MILGLIVLGVVCLSLKLIWDAHKESKRFITVSNWFKQHLNWTWVMFYLLTIILAFSIVVATVLEPPPTKLSYIDKSFTAHTYYLDGSIAGTFTVPKMEAITIVDEEALQSRNFWVGLLWFWPIYLIGTFNVSKWALKQKNRDLDWLWLTMLVLAITPLILSNKCVEKELSK